MIIEDKLEYKILYSWSQNNLQNDLIYGIGSDIL
jgi:hypothetical protein